MFELTLEEYEVLRCQTGTLKRGVHSKYLPFAFSEQGVAMLSSVLNSKHAIQVNIQIMRVFTKFRQILLSNKDIRRELEELKRVTDERFRIVFTTLDQLLSTEERPKRKIGFEVKEKAATYKKNNGRCCLCFGSSIKNNVRRCNDMKDDLNEIVKARIERIKSLNMRTKGQTSFLKLVVLL